MMWLLRVLKFQRFDVSTSRFVRTKHKTQWFFVTLNNETWNANEISYVLMLFSRKWNISLRFDRTKCETQFFLRETNETWNATSLFRSRFARLTHLVVANRAGCLNANLIILMCILFEQLPYKNIIIIISIVLSYIPRTHDPYIG
jgi:hypothetical protein